MDVETDITQVDVELQKNGEDTCGSDEIPNSLSSTGALALPTPQVASRTAPSTDTDRISVQGDITIANAPLTTGHLATQEPVNRGKLNRDGRSRPLKLSFPKNRSSIHTSKSTATAVSSIAAGSRHHDCDDIMSIQSTASSAAASYSRNFLIGFYNGKRQTRYNQKHGVLYKEYWMKDESARDCFACGKQFTTFRRKHHCRICGQIFCYACTMIIDGSRFGYKSKVRICQNCYEQADSWFDSSDDDLESNIEDTALIYEEQPLTHKINNTNILPTSSNTDQGTTNGDDKSRELLSSPLGPPDSANTPATELQNKLFFVHNDDVQSIITNPDDSQVLIAPPQPPPKMAIPATRQGESLEISLEPEGYITNERHRDPVRASTPSKSKSKYTIKDVDQIPKYKSYRNYGFPKTSVEKYNSRQSRKSLSQYGLRLGHISHDKPSFGRSRSNSFIEADSSSSDLENNQDQSLDNVFGNKSNRGYKFQFSYSVANVDQARTDEIIGSDYTPRNHSVGKSSNSRDRRQIFLIGDKKLVDEEAAFTVYPNLDEPNKSDNPMLSTRSTKSFQRAQASLQRMRSKMRSRSRANSESKHGAHNFPLQSTPNLLSVVANDESMPATRYNRNTNSSNSKPNHSVSWKRMTSLSSVRLQNEHKVQMDEVSLLHLETLLDQVINEQQLSSKDQWRTKILNFIEKLQKIDVNARDLNTLDYRQNFVKIKRIPGGSLANSEFINGMVFSKALPSKNMPRILSNPRILLVMFALEYQKNENQLLSLKAVAAQEKEYLDKLVSRVTSLRPDIVFVGANVSSYALKLLEKAGAIVQYNIKPQVMERIAKLTEADIAISIDKLASNVKMGECELFEVKTYVYGNMTRTYTYLKGCDQKLGGTIILRGLSLTKLRKVKQVTEFISYVSFALKLESSFFKDMFIELSISSYRDNINAKRLSKNTGYFSEFLDKLDRVLLSTSPTVQFPLPYLLNRARKMEAELKLKIERLDNPVSAQEDHKNLPQFLSTVSSTLPKQDLKKLLDFIRRREIQELELNFARKSHQWEVYYSMSRNILGTGTHQSISLLYSMVSTKTTMPCIGPQIITIDYFWDSDISLGQFIENIVNTAHLSCKQGCGGSLMDHYRSYVHGQGKIDVLIEKFQTRLPKLRDIIINWSYCKKCGVTTPILQLSDKTWNFSLGKYFEIIFWNDKTRITGIGKCPHDFAKDHIKYFGYNDLVVRMEFYELEIYELVMPSKEIQWRPNTDIKLKVELYHHVMKQGSNLYDSIKERLDRIKADVMEKKNPSNIEETIDGLKRRAEMERMSFISLLEKTFKELPSDERLNLNKVSSLLYNKTFEWTSELRNLGERLLISEDDNKQMTYPEPRMDTNLLVAKTYNDKNTDSKLNQESSSQLFVGDNGLEISDIHENNSMDYHRAHEKAEIIGAENKEEKNPILGTMEANHAQEHEVSTIKHEIIDNNEHSKKNSTLKDRSNRVSRLASYFDQMHLDALAKELEIQREMERLQINRSKNQALRSKSSVPIVKVYKDAHHAVDEPLYQPINSNNDSTQSNKNNRFYYIIENDVKCDGINQDGEIDHKYPETINTKDSEEGDGIRTDKSNDIEVPKNLKADTKPEIAQPEKSIVMKALANFWVDRSDYLFRPIVYPKLPTEHLFTDSDVIIREDEPTSLISFCFSTSDYLMKMKDLENKTLVDQKIDAMPQDRDCFGHVKENNVATEATGGDGVINAEGSIERSEKDYTKVDEIAKTSNLENVMIKKTAVHLRYQFEDGNVVMSCKIFFAEQFEAFRRVCRCNDNYVQSLSRCFKWESSGGKSGSGFLKTLDNRFVVKQLSHSELEAFIKFAPHYFEYMAQALFHELPTSLSKILGFYQLQVKNPGSGSKSYKIDVIIMENLFYDKKPTRIFDLKGSMRNRHVEQTGKENEVLLDENMVEYIYESPIHVREHDKRLLRACIWNDTLFLAKMNVMDYSLVVGIDSNDLTLTIGVIDFIRTFTWDKKLESWVKERGLVGGGSKTMKQPTVVTPKMYKNRFREAMERYILMVPDPWYQEYM